MESTIVIVKIDDKINLLTPEKFLLDLKYICAYVVLPTTIKLYHRNRLYFTYICTDTFPRFRNLFAPFMYTVVSKCTRPPHNLYSVLPEQTRYTIWRQ